jgi:high-affinity nickel permease
MTALSILAVGLLMGIKHATEADHLAAVATLAMRQSSLLQALRQGIAWGIGHTLTLMGFGGALLLLGGAVSPHLEQALETAVGAMLIVLGADVLRRLVRDRMHRHVRRHVGDIAHVDAHSHRDDLQQQALAHRDAQPVQWPVRALAVGMMHGLAGSAALVVLAVQTLPSVGLAIGYIALFGLGSIAGMALLSIVIAVPLKHSSGYLTRAHRAVTAAVGVFSCALGLFIVIEIGYLRQLLAA